MKVIGWILDKLPEQKPGVESTSVYHRINYLADLILASTKRVESSYRSSEHGERD